MNAAQIPRSLSAQGAKKPQTLCLRLLKLHSVQKHLLNQIAKVILDKNSIFRCSVNFCKFCDIIIISTGCKVTAQIKTRTFMSDISA